MTCFRLFFHFQIKTAGICIRSCLVFTSSNVKNPPSRVDKFDYKNIFGFETVTGLSLKRLKILIVIIFCSLLFKTCVLLNFNHVHINGYFSIFIPHRGLWLVARVMLSRKMVNVKTIFLLDGSDPYKLRHLVVNKKARTHTLGYV